jgi:hypothetical protein
MANHFTCPACGHQHQVVEERLGKRLKCTACGAVLKLSPGKAVPESPPQPAAEAGETVGPGLLKKALGDPSAALEGSVPSAISGVLAGVLVALLAGILRGETFGETVGNALLGFVIGCGLGTLLGAILGAAGRRLRPDFQSKAGFARPVGGALIGCLVVAIVVGFRWVPLGAGLGAVGAKLWTLLCDRVESATNAPGRINLEECLSDDGGRTDRPPSGQASSRHSGE